MLEIPALIAGAASRLPRLAQPAAAQTYPSQNVTVIVAFPAGGLADMIGAAGFDQARRPPQAELRGREPRRRRRQHRGQGGGRRRAGRLHAAGHDLGPCRQHDRLEEPRLRAERPAPGRLRRHQPRRDRHPSEQSGEGPQGVHRQRQGEELHLRQRRRRHRPADRRGVFLQGGRQGEIRARAVPGRRAGDHRDARQSRRLRWC